MNVSVCGPLEPVYMQKPLFEYVNTAQAAINKIVKRTLGDSA
jgi:hypothetical protein